MREICVRSSDSEIGAADVMSPVWQIAEEINVETYYSGAAAPRERWFSARMIWTETALCVRFEAVQAEPMIVSNAPDLSVKAMGLWDRDVCEIFVAPDKERPQRYFEFEAAPTGEWLDVAIDMSGAERLSDWEYRSGMRAASMIEPGRVITSIQVPWSAFGTKPANGDVWLGNLLRCVGKEPDRGYLAWQPTHTPQPNFHVPEKFGRFLFIGGDQL